MWLQFMKCRRRWVQTEVPVGAGRVRDPPCWLRGGQGAVGTGARAPWHSGHSGHRVGTLVLYGQKVQLLEKGRRSEAVGAQVLVTGPETDDMPREAHGAHLPVSGPRVPLVTQDVVVPKPLSPSLQTLTEGGPGRRPHAAELGDLE